MAKVRAAVADHETDDAARRHRRPDRQLGPPPLAVLGCARCGRRRPRHRPGRGVTARPGRRSLRLSCDCVIGSTSPDGDPIVSAEVGDDLDVVEADRAHQFRDARALTRADLQHQPPIRPQPPRSLGDDVADLVETVGAAEQRVGRAPTRARSVRARDRRRRRTAGSTRPSPARRAARPAARRTSRLGEVERWLLPVRCPPRWPAPRRAHLTSDRSSTRRPRRSAARWRATIRSHRCRCRGRRQTIGSGCDRAQSERNLDDQLGLRPRDQHAPVDHQIEMAETPPAEHVLQRLTGRRLGRASRRGGQRRARLPARSSMPDELVAVMTQRRPRTSIAPVGGRRAPTSRPTAHAM